MATYPKTVNNNPLLVKGIVGKTRPTVFDLPAPDHIYGKSIDRNPDETAAKALHQWHVKANSKHAIPSLDYISMNRYSLSNGITNSAEIREFRKEHPVRMKVGDHSVMSTIGDNNNSATAEISCAAALRKKRGSGPLPSDHDGLFTYGKATRPSTPVSRLMTDFYQREWMEEQDRRYQKEVKEKEKTRRKNIHKSVESRLHKPIKHQTIFERDVSTLFKMSKFKNVPAAISCWRNGNGEDAEYLTSAELASAMEALDMNSGKHQSQTVSSSGNVPSQKIQKNVRQNQIRSDSSASNESHSRKKGVTFSESLMV